METDPSMAEQVWRYKTAVDYRPQADWGNPILPILLSLLQFSDTMGFPASKDLQVGLAVLLRQAPPPP